MVLNTSGGIGLRIVGGGAVATPICSEIAMENAVDPRTPESKM